MTVVVLVAPLLGALMMSTATLRASAAERPLRPGDPLPSLTGQFLTGRKAVLPKASSGNVALVALGFTYQSRVPVEAWGGWLRETMGSRTDVTFFEVPMIGGMATLGRWFIDRGMRKGTPEALHDHVLTVYGGTDTWKSRLSYASAHKADAYLIVLDRQGIVRWLHHGPFDQPSADQLRRVLTALVDRDSGSGDPDRSSVRHEP